MYKKLQVTNESLECGDCKQLLPDEMFAKANDSRYKHRRYRGVQCKPCKSVRKKAYQPRTRKYYCIDCGTFITKENARCKPCSFKARRIGYITKYGYRRITVPGHPNANKRGEMMEHVYVMSQHLGRPLYNNERVHHKNGIRDDNSLDNLELWSITQPCGQRLEDKINFCLNFLKIYKPEALREDFSWDGKI